MQNLPGNSFWLGETCKSKNLVFSGRIACDTATYLSILFELFKVLKVSQSICKCRGAIRITEDFGVSLTCRETKEEWEEEEEERKCFSEQNNFYIRNILATFAPGVAPIFIICESISHSRLREWHSIYKIPDLYLEIIKQP